MNSASASSTRFLKQKCILEKQKTLLTLTLWNAAEKQLNEQV